jgi:nucleoside-diphosphate-sugar epimerase
MTKLIIGCGYLGLRLARFWRERGHHVVATRRSPEMSTELARLGVDIIPCDVLDPASLTRLPAADTVAHAVALDRASGQTMRAVYVDGLVNVLRHLPATKRFIYVSSSGVYGQAEGEWVDEDAPTEPREESGRIVLEAEAVLRAAAPHANILRLAGIYGPGRLLRQKAIVAGEPIVAGADRWLNLIHVEDGARAVLAAEEFAEPGRVFNVSDGRPVLRREFYAELARILHAPAPSFAPPAADLPAPPHEQANRRISNARLLRELHFTFLYGSYLEGLEAATVRER